MRAVDALMECLKAEGVDVVFGLPGGACHGHALHCALRSYDAHTFASERLLLCGVFHERLKQSGHCRRFTYPKPEQFGERILRGNGLYPSHGWRVDSWRRRSRIIVPDVRHE